MNVNDQHYRTIWEHPTLPHVVQVIDQRNLPHEFNIEDLTSVDDVARAIEDMHVRGAGLIGAAAGYGMYLAAVDASNHNDYFSKLQSHAKTLINTRPTAVNLSFAIDRQLRQLSPAMSIDDIVQKTLETARAIADEDVLACKQIGAHGLKLIQDIAHKKPDKTINILTHCNAGWLAFVDYGSATAPIYAAHAAGIPIHVWVDETRPRNQGTRLTAWELEQHGVPFTIIPDNVGGHLMQHNLVDMVIVGSDRTTFTGDVANKVGTYLKALAAADNDVPFYVALPSSTFDWKIRDGVRDIPIEQRGAEEVKHIQGLLDGSLATVLLSTKTATATNFAFDVTPARLVTALITERGVCKANSKAVLTLFPERRPHDR